MKAIFQEGQSPSPRGGDLRWSEVKDIFHDRMKLVFGIRSKILFITRWKVSRVDTKILFTTE
jgi:hypothetical protein